MSEPDQSPAPAKNDIWHITAELIKTVLIVGILAYAIRVFILQPFIVEGSSMAPRFHTNDYLLVDKLSFRFHQPSRGDIVVFKYPNDPSLNYIKRVIGLPGETVRIENGEVTIVNDEHKNGVLLDESAYLSKDLKTNLPNGANKAEFSVPPASYFVLGDNRPASSDSREWGFLPQANIIGRAMVQAYPFDHISVVQHAAYTEN